MQVEESLKCVVMACRKPILKGDTYYLLGGGKLVNCKTCACDMPVKLVINNIEINLTRSWDKTAINERIKHVL